MFTYMAGIIACMLPVLLTGQPVQRQAQNFSTISFQHLTTANGLSYSTASDICTDRSGNLWVATGNGLNMFNGKTVDKYYMADYPQLESNNIIQLICDDDNRIWILTDKRTVAMIDEQRHLHKVSLFQSKEALRVRMLMYAKGTGAILFTNKGHFVYNPSGKAPNADSISQQSFSALPIQSFDSLQRKRLRQIFKFDDSRYFFSQDTLMFIVNYQSKKVEGKCTIPFGSLLVKWSDESVLMYNANLRKLQSVNIFTGAVTNINDQLKDQYGHIPDDYFTYAEKLNSNQYLLTTVKSGVYIYNRLTNQIYNYRHNASDPNSLSSDQVYKIAYNSNGWAFVIAAPNGVSYFNTREVIGNQNIFQDNRGKIYDGNITCIASEDNNTYYLGTSSGLIEWKRNVNATRFIDFKDTNGKALLEHEELQTLCFDEQGKLWVSTTSKGIFILDRNKQLIRRLVYDGKKPDALKIWRVFTLKVGKDGYMWASGENGICRINTNNFAIDNLANTPFTKLANTFVSPIFFSDSNNIWIGVTDGGVWHYNFATGKLAIHTKENGLLSNYVFSINQDEQKNIYIGTDLGVDILMKDGRMKTITTKDGLMIPRAEALLTDKKGRMWIGNDIGVACYTVQDSSLAVFDERFGISIYGFRVNAYYQNMAGEFVFGTPRGVQYFFPEDLFRKRINLNALISRIETKDISSGITRSSEYKLASYDNYVTFHFTSVDYSNHLNTFYEYKLEGNDKDWITVTNQNSVHYSSLQPGTYKFRLRVSNNKKDWQYASNEVTINIPPPYWKTWWFRLLGILAGVSLIGYVINFYRSKQKKKQNELETALVVTYFASQINKHNDTDALLWDVAKNCISRLHFEDCVIYLYDAEREVLVQKAAFGPKSINDHVIHHPIDIPLGKGIVGSVAQTGQPEIIHNTKLDSRYIVDDEQRCSEIAVPIVIDGKVAGVIDSEHSRKHFFTSQHLKVLTTIAALCAGQMQLAKAEEEKKKAEIELLQNKQKALESRLQSLRLQMNPHFLFNALNSVQQMILANEEMIATKYLSRFSKLLRAILVHSDKETISLKEELDILHLYVELESIRFKEAFTYSITCDENIDTDEVRVPTLLVQPFVENAIWHGLMHKEGDRKLLVAFEEKGESLQCIVEDNGVGRKKASEIKGVSLNGTNHQSKGIAVSTERLKALKNTDGESGSILFVDLHANDGTSAGTRIEINFPIQ